MLTSIPALVVNHCVHHSLCHMVGSARELCLCTWYSPPQMQTARTRCSLAPLPSGLLLGGGLPWAREHFCVLCLQGWHVPLVFPLSSLLLLLDTTLPSFANTMVPLLLHLPLYLSVFCHLPFFLNFCTSAPALLPSQLAAWEGPTGTKLLPPTSLITWHVCYLDFL